MDHYAGPLQAKPQLLGGSSLEDIIESGWSATVCSGLGVLTLVMLEANPYKGWAYSYELKLTRSLKYAK
jgi:hypothetical protein